MCFSACFLDDREHDGLCKWTGMSEVHVQTWCIQHYHGLRTLVYASLSAKIQRFPLHWHNDGVGQEAMLSTPGLWQSVCLFVWLILYYVHAVHKIRLTASIAHNSRCGSVPVVECCSEWLV